MTEVRYLSIFQMNYFRELVMLLSFAKDNDLPTLTSCRTDFSEMLLTKSDVIGSPAEADL